LLCGTTVTADSVYGVPQMVPGVVDGCFEHAQLAHAGIAPFLLVQRSCVVLIAQGGAGFCGSPYLDEHGEEDVGLRRGRPLALDAARYEALRGLLLSYEALDYARKRPLVSHI
jgi:hypothetical protein